MQNAFETLGRREQAVKTRSGRNALRAARRCYRHDPVHALDLLEPLDLDGVTVGDRAPRLRLLAARLPPPRAARRDPLHARLRARRGAHARADGTLGGRLRDRPAPLAPRPARSRATRAARGAPARLTSCHRENRSSRGRLRAAPVSLVPARGGVRPPRTSRGRSSATEQRRENHVRQGMSRFRAASTPAVWEAVVPRTTPAWTPRRTLTRCSRPWERCSPRSRDRPRRGAHRALLGAGRPARRRSCVRRSRRGSTRIACSRSRRPASGCACSSCGRARHDVFDVAQSARAHPIVEAMRGGRRRAETQRPTPRRPLPAPRGFATPASSVYERTGSYFCYGCQAGGDVIDFVGRLRGSASSTRSALARARRCHDRSARTTAVPLRAGAGRERGASRRGSGGGRRRGGRAATRAQLDRSRAAQAYLRARGIRARRRCAGSASATRPAASLRASRGGRPARTPLGGSGCFASDGSDAMRGRIVVPDLDAGRSRDLARVAPSAAASRATSTSRLPLPLLGLGAVRGARARRRGRGSVRLAHRLRLGPARGRAARHARVARRARGARARFRRVYLALDAGRARASGGQRARRSARRTRQSPSSSRAPAST